MLQYIDDAVIVMDGERQLRFVNRRARALLGYSPGDRIGGRCRHTTRGIDCELACPLTFALDQELVSVRDFETTYRRADERDVPLRVTVLPLRDEDGDFVGAVEILRPVGLGTGFFLSGRGPEVGQVRERLTAVVDSGADVVLVGERPIRLDVARDLHRISGLGDELFHVWRGAWGEVTPWPAGTRYADGEDGLALFDQEMPKSWRRVVGVGSLDGARSQLPAGVEVIDLPSVGLLHDDLPTIVAAWAQQIGQGLEPSAAAVRQLVEIAANSGFEEAGIALRTAVAVADGQLLPEHIPTPSDDVRFVDRLLDDADPFASLEKALVVEVLERSSWRMQEAAVRLGISRVTLWRKLKEHGIQKPG